MSFLTKAENLMPTERNQLSRSICRDETMALAVFWFCTVSAIALIPVSLWGMVRLELSTGEIFLGSLLTFTLSILLMVLGGGIYLFVKHRPEPVKVSSVRSPEEGSNP